MAGAAALRARLGHVYWLGGGGGGGKSTIAGALAARHGLRREATDEVVAAHGPRLTARRRPVPQRGRGHGHGRAVAAPVTADHARDVRLVPRRGLRADRRGPAEAAAGTRRGRRGIPAAAAPGATAARPA